MWLTEVIHIETKEVVKTFTSNNRREAERLEIGLLYQTNLNDYFVSTKEVKE